MAASGFDVAERVKELVGPPPPGTPYSVAIPGSQKDARTAVYRHWRYQDALLKTVDPAVTSALELFESAAQRLPTHHCLGHRPYDTSTKTFGPYQWIDYGTVQRRKNDFGAGLVELHRRVGVTGTQYGVGLWCQNRPDWQVTDLACMSQSLFSVSIYDTLGPDVAEYIVNHATLTCVVTSLNHVPSLLRLRSRCPTLKLIVSLDPLDDGGIPEHSRATILGAWAAEVGVQIYHIGDVEELGRSHPHPQLPPRPEDIVTVNYTSGTTGNPKGVVLTHANAVAAASSGRVTIPLGPSDVFCSYLPLAHIYERVAQHNALWAGSQIGFFHGNILELVDDIKLLRPTKFLSVPRLYNRFGSGVRAATVEQTGLKGALSRHIVSTKLANLESSGRNTHAVYDRIWGRKVTAALGMDRVDLMVSGSAPLDPGLQQFLRVVFGNHFLQGYGLTETYAVGLAQQPGDMSAGTCGAVAPCMEACLMDVPEMEYLHTDTPRPRGELLLRGNALFREYFRDEAETRKAILPDGWFRTGDICSVDELGRFAVVDRVKNVMKLAHGEYISPERIENVYLANCSWLAQAYVHGESSKDHLVAIFGVDPDTFAPFAQRVLGGGAQLSAADKPGLLAVAQDVGVRKAVLQELDRVAKKSRFNGYERVRNCYLYLEPFTIENELLTPTLKLKRPQSAKRYRADLERLYEELNGASTSSRVWDGAAEKQAIKSKL